MSQIFNKSGGYRKLHSFNFAAIVHLGTISFCRRFLSFKDDPLGKTAGQLGKQLQSLEAAFIENGGIRERMTQARLEARDGEVPSCPECGKPMRKRKSPSGEFWGCSGYPDCRGRRAL